MTMTMWMSENQACQSHVYVMAFWCLKVKSQKAGLNRRHKARTAGVLTQHLIM
jgi:hypothetical protein